MTLPVALSGSDVIGQAKTGTGKTLGFGLPLLERVTVPADVEAGRAEPEDLTDAPQALVVVPTRELCTQVTNDLLTAGKVRNVRVLAIYGGRAYEPQVEALKKGVDVVVGTPGRLLDLAGQKKLNLKHVRCLVLDEADEMLDLGFLPDVEKIINMLPVRRQTMLFSATMPGAVIGLARRYMSQPTHISATSPDDAGKTVANTKQYIYRAHNMDKPEMVARILQADGRGLVMVFCRTKRTAADLADQLQQRGFASGAVHGDLGQGAREQALRAFRNGKVDVLVCTDVAARGIDVEGVTHVINYQSPEDEKTYLHRIGRTGRAGAKGIAITLVDWDDIPRWQLINKALDLGFNDPPETYSTSPHLYADLGIPEGTKGVLPRSERKRAGLAAEELEDLGETGGRGQRGRGGRGRGGRDGSPSADRERAARTPRRRRRTRGGTPLEGAPESTGAAAPDTTATGGSAEAEAVTGPRTPRRRRRTRGGASAESAPVTAVESPTSEPADNAVATAEGTSTEAAPSRRRRTRRSETPAVEAEAAVTPSAAAEAPAEADAASVVAAPVADQPEAPASRPRRRTRRTTAASTAESALDTAEGTTESAAETTETKPRRTRKTAAASEAPAAPAEAAETKPRRTRKAAAAVAEDAVDTAETAAAKPRRTRKAAAAQEDAAGEAQATEPKPRRTRKTTAAATDTAEGTEAKPRRTRKAAAAVAEDAVGTAETAEAKPRRTRKTAASVADAEAADVKPRRTRKTAASAEAAADTAEGTEAKPRRRTRKAVDTVEPAESVAAGIPAQTGQEPEAAEAKPRRARKATAKAEASVDTAEAAEAKPRRTRKTAAAAADAETAEAKPRRTRKTAAAAEAAADTAEGTEAKPRRRTRKVTEPAGIPAQAGQEPEAAEPRRTRKSAAAATASAEAADDVTEAKPRARRTRKATAGAEPTEG
ncbi:DEAD/DEAH box helicase [Streptomyces coeruleorubidus]|uniref:RNA helicase n=1 Tax=Streptomyces coeruleorubidus TaxID=116188 RepID=A0ABZ0K9V6_STRC4|nr:DEAD/DEAH box helicase [Streptomyces coeruleorubidus]WOT34471.1 DEAD/DEAH box helicase [Streptomyces coeruleorubidus]